MRILMGIAGWRPTPRNRCRHIKRLVRSAVQTPFAEGLRLERNLFMDLRGSNEAIARMRAYEGRQVTDPAETLRP